MSSVPKAYIEFTNRFTHLNQAWNNIREEEQSGPLDEKMRRLIKLAIAVGAQKTGATHSAARKANKSNVSLIEMEQIVALAASTIGLPGAVAAWCQIKESLEK